MQSRINGLGVSEPEIRKQGSDQIVIQLAGVHDPAKAARLIGKTAQLMLFDFESDVTGPSARRAMDPLPSLHAPERGPVASEEGITGGVPTSTKTTTTKATKKGAKPTTTVTHSVDKRSPAVTLTALLKPFGGRCRRTRRS